ncbi:MAG: 6-carboxytetrahydropterin synthase QueD [Candidatus Aminicenantales bacterium]
MSWKLKVSEKFQAAHFLKGYRGKCEKIHGHTFKVEVEIEIANLDSRGISIDFNEIKEKLASILPDHKFLNEVYDFNPSAENLAQHFFHELKAHFPLKKVTVWESDNASATYSESS